MNLLFKPLLSRQLVNTAKNIFLTDILKVLVKHCLESMVLRKIKNIFAIKQHFY